MLSGRASRRQNVIPEPAFTNFGLVRRPQEGRGHVDIFHDSNQPWRGFLLAQLCAGGAERAHAKVGSMPRDGPIWQPRHASVHFWSIRRPDSFTACLKPNSANAECRPSIIS